MISTTYLYGGIALLALVALGGSAAALWYYRQFSDGVEDRLDEILADTDEAVEFAPAEITRTPVDYFRAMRHLQMAKKAAKKGYVRWELLGSTASRRRWVKPEQKGNGIPEYKHDGQTYFFPKESMVIDEETGAWKAQHRVGEADPINLRDPAYPGLETDLIERTINLVAENDPDTGFFSSLGGMSSQAMLYGGIALLFVLYAAYAYSTGMIG